jgi:hypothetical protein
MIRAYRSNGEICILLHEFPPAKSSIGVGLNGVANKRSDASSLVNF